MKLFSKIALLFAVLLIAVCFAQAQQCESVVVNDVSTFTVTGDDYVFNANPLVIGSGTYISLIKEIDISVLNSANAPQTITLWDGWTNGTSSAAVTKIWEVEIASNSAGGMDTVYQKSFGDRWMLKADRGLAITKSDTTGTVRVSLQYR